jgi:plastocyanin
MPTATRTATPAPTATPSPASPQVIHVGFNLGEHTDAQFGPVYFYSLGNAAQVIRVTHGSKVVFLNDDTIPQPHTASGFGTAGFPMSFNNGSGATQHGTTIDGSTTWSTGTLNHGQMSQVFTIGPPGTYFFGCAFHYVGVPTASNISMGDVIVSM